MEKDWQGASPSLRFVPGRPTPRQQKRGYRQDSLPGETRLLQNIEASYLCLDVYMHESPVRFIFFINMLIEQVQILKNTNLDSRDYII